MSRLHLIACFLLFSLGSNAQNELGKYLEFAEQQYRKGDYIYALTYYEKAMELDSNSVSTLWKYAETLRAYKDYRKAAYYYEKVYSKEDALIYPSSLLYWALMEKQNGNYTKAIELFKRAKKKYAKDKRGYTYLKSKRELESCLWAQSALKDTAEVLPLTLPEGLNTVNSEFGHGFIDSLFLFSSLRSDSVGMNEEIYDISYTNQLYTFPVFDSTGGQAERIRALNETGIDTGNGTFSPDGKRFYFSRCTSEDQQFNCQIAVSRYTNGKWSKPELLGDIINEVGANTTMPAIAVLDNEEILFFASNKEDGKGGMDLYFSVIKNDGNQFGKVRAVPRVNSPDDDLAPWYDAQQKRLYFSSSWWDGFGGYDVQYAPIVNGTYAEPVNAGLPVNSPANDLYYFREGDSLFVSSNRLGVLYAKNPTCCSDVFAYAPPIVVVPETKKETLADLNKRLPVTLYFHNDIPDPRSHEPTTKVNYSDSYHDYTDMLPEYRKEYSKGLAGQRITEAEEDIESFFTEYVEQGMKDLTLFKTLLLEELQKGYRIRLSVRGFASPLAKTEYNVPLTKRRIASLVNHLRVCDGGVFAPYLDGTAINGGKLEVVGVPFGEYTADQLTSDNPNDLKNSIFSRAAARERKIEIQSVSYLDTDSLFFLVDVEPTSIVLGKTAMKQAFTKTFSVYNSSENPLVIAKIEVRDSLFTAQFNPVIGASKRTVITLSPAKSLPAGIFSLPMDIYFEGYDKPMRVMILGEGI
jgi:hypothetical protein